jgi:hypothetical protein
VTLTLPVGLTQDVAITADPPRFPASSLLTAGPHSGTTFDFTCPDC